MPVIAPPQLAPTAALPHEIIEDTDCLECGYNLRGLRSDGRCPECGTAVGRSLYGNFLRFAQPTYVRKLAGGVTLILWGMLVSFVVAAVAMIVVGGPQEIALSIAFLGGLVSVVGTWQVTSPDPGKLDAQWGLTSRRLVRATVLIGLGAGLLEIVKAYTGTMSHAAQMVTGILGIALAVVQLVGEFARFIYFCRLALRIPDRALARSTRIVMWGHGITMALVVLCGAISIASGPSSTPGSGPMSSSVLIGVAALAGVSTIGATAFSIWWLCLLFKYRRRFIDQAHVAERSWCSQPEPATPQPLTPGI